MSIDVVSPDARHVPASKRIQWWAYLALAAFALATTLFVIYQAWTSVLGAEFWALMIGLTFEWVFFCTMFWLSKSKPRRRK